MMFLSLAYSHHLLLFNHLQNEGLKKADFIGNKCAAKSLVNSKVCKLLLSGLFSAILLRILLL